MEWDGQEITYPCEEGVTHVRKATTVTPEGGAILIQPQRFVFPWDGTFPPGS